MDLAKSFLESAKSHIIDSKILYKNKRYPSAIFHLQQGVEIITKSFGLVNEFIASTDLKKVGHRPHKVFEKPIIENHQKIKQAIELEKKFPDFFVFTENSCSLTEYEKDLKIKTNDLLHLNPADFEFIEIEDIELIIQQFEEFSIAAKFDLQKVRNEMPQIHAKVSKHLKKINTEMALKNRTLKFDKFRSDEKTRIKETKVSKV